MYSPAAPIYYKIFLKDKITNLCKQNNYWLFIFCVVIHYYITIKLVNRSYLCEFVFAQTQSSIYLSI